MTQSYTAGGTLKVREACNEVMRRYPELAEVLSGASSNGQPLTSNTVDPFPLKVLSEPLREFVQEGAKSLSCPVDLLALPMLVVAGAAIGTTRVLQVKRGWREGPRVYGTIVAEPGGVKSPALNLVAQPLYLRQEILAEAFARKADEHKTAMAHYEVKLQAWKDEARKSAKTKGGVNSDPPTSPDSPSLVRVFTSDTTVEALAVLLRDNPRGLVIICDELTGWVRAMNQYKGGKGADRQFYLSAWSGLPYPIDRKQGPLLLLFNPFANVVGCIPPDMLDELADERGRQDGFLHRLLFAYPAPVPWGWSEDTVSEAASNAWHRTVEALLRLSPAMDEEGKPTPRVLSFTPMGKEVWVAWCDAHAAELANPDLPNTLQGPWAKMPTHAARLALILQELRYGCDQAADESVDETSVKGAWALIDYFKGHARRVYRRLRIDKGDKQAEAAVIWIKAKGEGCTARELLTYGVAGVKRQSEAIALLKDLVDRQLGQFQETTSPSGRGRKTQRFMLATSA